MKITVKIKSNNDEAVELGPETAAAMYLQQIVDKIEIAGRLSGAVIDGNGAVIGEYKVTS